MYCNHVCNIMHVSTDHNANKMCHSFHFLLCTRDCPTNYTCLPGIGENPRFGYSNFDNFGWSMLNAFQLITLDFWEDPYNKVHNHASTVGKFQ